MKLSRTQFTLKGLMILIAVSAVLMSTVHILRRRQLRFQALADLHIARSIKIIRHDDLRGYYGARIGPEGIYTSTPELGARHEELAAKYTRAASYPWLSVEPDPAGYPPEP